MANRFDELLNELHTSAVQVLLEKVQSGEATAAELTAALNFLKYNQHSMSMGKNPALDGLAKSLAKYDADIVDFPH